MYIVDVLEVKQVEKHIGAKLTSHELDIARNNEGHVSKSVRGKVHHLKFTLIKFPYDLLSEQQQSKSMEGVFYNEHE